MRVLIAVLAFVPALAFAHVDMIDPPRRYGRTDLKSGPCGMPFGEPGEVVASYAGGSTIDIQISEYIDHPGHHRVALDVDGGDDNLGDPICLTNCDDRRSPDPTFEDPPDVLVLGNFEDADSEEQTLRVTLPNVTCERCTLQVIQVMYDKRPYTLGGDDNYYRCADIAITSDGEDAGPSLDAGVTEDAGSPSDAGAAPDASTDAAMDASRGDDTGTAVETPMSEGGCSLARSSSRRHSLGLVASVLVAFVLRRRRRRCFE